MKKRRNVGYVVRAVLILVENSLTNDTYRFQL